MAILLPGFAPKDCIILLSFQSTWIFLVYHQNVKVRQLICYDSLIKTKYESQTRWTDGRTIKPTNKIINNVIKDCKHGTVFNLDHTDMQKIVIIELLKGGWLIKMSSPRKIYCTSPWNRNQQSSMTEQWHNYSWCEITVLYFVYFIICFETENRKFLMYTSVDTYITASTCSCHLK